MNPLDPTVSSSSTYIILFIHVFVTLSHSSFLLCYFIHYIKDVNRDHVSVTVKERYYVSHGVRFRDSYTGGLTLTLVSYSSCLTDTGQ